jgi:DNA polymerase III sliding clamp (beta) subunit (PCNA family)
MQVLIRNGTVTACDGGRLHRVDLRAIGTTADLTIPTKVVDELLKALRNSDAEFLRMGYDDQHLVFRIEDDSIVAQRLLIPFPEVESLLLGPAFSNTNTLTVDRVELADSIKRVRVNADPDSAVILLSLLPGKKDDQGNLQWSLAIRAKDRQGNASQEVIGCQWVGNGKPQELAFNHHYLSDLLAVYDSETVIFRVGDDTKTLKTPLFLEDRALGFTAIVQQVAGVWAR